MAASLRVCWFCAWVSLSSPSSSSSGCRWVVSRKLVEPCRMQAGRQQQQAEDEDGTAAAENVGQLTVGKTKKKRPNINDSWKE